MRKKEEEEGWSFGVLITLYNNVKGHVKIVKNGFLVGGEICTRYIFSTKVLLGPQKGFFAEYRPN